MPIVDEYNRLIPIDKFCHENRDKISLEVKRGILFGMTNIWIIFCKMES